MKISSLSFSAALVALAASSLTAQGTADTMHAGRPEPWIVSAAARPPARAGSGSRWSVRMAESVVRRKPVVHEKWDYTAGLVLTAIERVGIATHDPRYAAYVRSNMDRLVADDGTIRTYRVSDFNLDQINQGRLLFGLAQSTHDPRYLAAARTLRDQLRRQPRTGAGGFWHKQIYPGQMWLDGLYMAEPFYAQYAATEHDTAAFTDIARQFLLAYRYMRDADTGLLRHGWDESGAQPWADSATGRSPSAWGRAVGWYLMALVDVLEWLPDAHPDRAALVRVLRDESEAVARVQDPLTGLWYQVLDAGSRRGNYFESSASSMFVYAFARGARNGWLDARFASIAQRGFDGLVTNLVTVDDAGLVSLHNVCAVAGLGGPQRRSGTFEYYVSEPVVANDDKGVGAFILAALAVER